METSSQSQLIPQIKEGIINVSWLSLKEIKMRPVTETHDYEFKVKNAKKFIAKGDKVKITIRFKGRELQHSHLGNELMGKTGGPF